ncbi:transmembrane protein 44 isoform X2 [Choloepus didactylus]|uniref:transmembrane protein 44 isoform X2 n=1 Tax=Choloepus didactylus TaxID=27675 RepID=UPI00189C62DD|nr:transmembrane protein 44 isoform X2 [Choloepus didactylus]
MGEAEIPAPALWDWDYLDRCFARHRVCISFGLWICASSCWIAAHALLLYLRCTKRSQRDQSALCAASCLLASLCDTVGAILARQLAIQVFTGAYLATVDLVNFMFILFPVCGSKFKSNSGLTSSRFQEPHWILVSCRSRLPGKEEEAAAQGQRICPGPAAEPGPRLDSLGLCPEGVGHHPGPAAEAAGKPAAGKYRNPWLPSGWNRCLRLLVFPDPPTLQNQNRTKTKTGEKEGTFHSVKGRTLWCRGKTFSSIHLWTRFLSALAGLIYASAIVAHDRRPGYLLRATPWFLISLGGAALDLAIIFLSCVMKSKMSRALGFASEVRESPDTQALLTSAEKDEEEIQNLDWVPLTMLPNCKPFRTMAAISCYMELTIEPVQQAGCSATRLPGDGQTGTGDAPLREPPSYPLLQVIRARVSSSGSSEVSSVNSDLEQKYWEALNLEQVWTIKLSIPGGTSHGLIPVPVFIRPTWMPEPRPNAFKKRM